MLNQLKLMANKKDIPYQSLIKVHLAEMIAEERIASQIVWLKTQERRAWVRNPD